MRRLQQSLTAAVPPELQPPADIPPGQVRWLVDHLAKHRTHSMTRLVRALDERARQAGRPVRKRGSRSKVPPSEVFAGRPSQSSRIVT